MRYLRNQPQSSPDASAPHSAHQTVGFGGEFIDTATSATRNSMLLLHSMSGIPGVGFYLLQRRSSNSETTSSFAKFGTFAFVEVTTHSSRGGILFDVHRFSIRRRRDDHRRIRTWHSGWRRTRALRAHETGRKERRVRHGHRGVGGAGNKRRERIYCTRRPPSSIWYTWWIPRKRQKQNKKDIQSHGEYCKRA